MKKVFTLILFALIAIAVIKVGSVAYNVINISSVYPPMKKYEYRISAFKLHDIILIVDRADTNLQCIVTDTTGKENNLKYYMDVRMKIENESYSYRITYKNENKFWKKDSYVNLGLVAAFDSIHKIGGYKKEENGVEDLIDIFDKNFISRIERKLASMN